MELLWEVTTGRADPLRGTELGPAFPQSARSKLKGFEGQNVPRYKYMMVPFLMGTVTNPCFWVMVMMLTTLGRRTAYLQHFSKQICDLKTVQWNLESYKESYDLRQLPFCRVISCEHCCSERHGTSACHKLNPKLTAKTQHPLMLRT